MIPWDNGRCLAWDYTCTETVAPSHLSSSTIAAGLYKSEKYSELVPSYVFVPVAIETLGVWGARCNVSSCRNWKEIAISSGDPRSGLFLWQQIGMAMQRGNSKSVLGTIKLPPLAW